MDYSTFRIIGESLVLDDDGWYVTTCLATRQTTKSSPSIQGIAWSGALRFRSRN